MKSMSSDSSSGEGWTPSGDRRGSALIVILLITMVLSALVLSALMTVQNEIRLTSNESMRTRAFHLAERGVEESIAYLAQLGQPLAGAGPGGGQPVCLYEAKAVDEGNVTAWADPMDSNGGHSTRFVTVTVRGTLPGSGVSRAIRVRLGQRNFSRFAYFSDLETAPPSASTIWFTGRDEFLGPVHSNDQLHIYENPVFHGQLSSSSDLLDYYHGGPPRDDPVFAGGLELGVPSIPLPANTDLLRAKALEPGGLHFSGNPVEVEMFVDGRGLGRLRVRIDGGAWAEHDLPAGGVLHVDGKVQLKGVLKGQLTLGCSGDIEIMDNCVYDTDPRVDPAGKDLLGLVAEGNVFMDGDPRGPNADSADETVMAVIMALGDSFTAENYDSGPPRGGLVIYGGLIQRFRGAVGTFNPYTEQITSGYSKAYAYDPRLMDSPPPAFPTTGEIDKMSWEEVDPGLDIAANIW